jgi:16S rRNA (guanine527-N7)-methyltransferase
LRIGERGFARGPGRPGREPDESRQTDVPRRSRSERRRERREEGPASPRREALTGPREPLPTRLRDVAQLPPDAVRVLDQGLAALGLPVQGAARDAIDGHLRLLLAWTQAINLTAIREPAAAARLHVLDALTAVPLLRERSVHALLDLGSGGGYPGIPLAAEVPARAMLVEPIAKKARFLTTVVDALGFGDRIEVRADRAEALALDPMQREAWPMVTARAVAALPDLVELAMPLLAVGGALVAWKRGDVDGELAAAARAASVLGAGAPAVHPAGSPGLDDHVLVVVPKLVRTPDRFPRPPAVRSRRPW